jgi:SHAQKYF class myb-like DNA-binding protein
MISRSNSGTNLDVGQGSVEPERPNGSFNLDEIDFEEFADLGGGAGGAGGAGAEGGGGQADPDSYAGKLEKLAATAGPVEEQPTGGGTVVGRWTDQEQAAFITGLKKFGRSWKDVQGLIKTRTLTQIRTHAQKFFRKVKKERELAIGRGDSVAVQNLTRLLETGPLHPNSACHRPQPKQFSGVRPRTDPETGVHIRLASSDQFTPSHTDKRSRGYHGEVDPFSHLDPRVPRVGMPPPSVPMHSPRESAPGHIKGWMGLDRSLNERTGEWSFHEENYGNQLIREFQAGRLEVANRTQLLRYLMSSLQAQSARISAKYGMHCDLNAEYSRRVVPECAEETAERAEDMAELRKLYFDELKFENMKREIQQGASVGGGGGSTAARGGAMDMGKGRGLANPSESSPFFAIAAQRAATAAAANGGIVPQNTSDLDLVDTISDLRMSESTADAGGVDTLAGQLRAMSTESTRSQNFSLSGLFDNDQDAAELMAVLDETPGSRLGSLGDLPSRTSIGHNSDDFAHV